MISVGIDFGTSTTIAAIYRDGQTELVKNAAGQEVTPSCIAFPPNGSIVVGTEAKKRRIIDPANALYSVKRILGQRWDQPGVQKFRQQYPFTLELGTDNLPYFVTRAGKLTAEDVAVHLLTNVHESPALKVENVEDVTLTVPTSFTPEQREALSQAAARAGFETVDIINEPCAAALAFLEGSDRDQVVVVYDLGGGTFDLTVLHCAGSDYQVIGVGGDIYSDYEVLGAGGDGYLGGDDIDLCCANWVADQVLQRHQWDIRSSDASFQKLLLSCEAAKQLLSLVERQSIDLSPIDEVLRNETVELTQADIARLCHDLVRRTFVICDDTMARAGATIADVGTVVLSGGGCHMPMIRAGVKHYFNQEPKSVAAPDRTVAIGAALHAGRNAADR